MAKPENQNYFRDAKDAERVRDRQKEHPDHWKHTARYQRRTLQDDCSEQAPAAEGVAPTSPSRTLQDLCSMQALPSGRSPLPRTTIGCPLPTLRVGGNRNLLSHGGLGNICKWLIV